MQWIKTTLAVMLTAGTFAFGSNLAFAAGSLPANTITKVSFMPNGFLMYADNWANPNACDNAGAVVLLNSDPNFDKAYALLLTAYSTGKTVSGYSDGCTNVDGTTYNTIRGFKYLVVN